MLQKQVILLFLVILSLFNFSRATLFTFPRSCNKTQGETEEVLRLSECEKPEDIYVGEMFTYMSILHRIFDIKKLNLVLIIADNMPDGNTLARFLSNNRKVPPLINRMDFVDEQLAANDFILNYINMYENTDGHTFLVYPQQAHNDHLASLLALEIIRHAKSIKIILTSSYFPIQDNNVVNERELQVHRLLDTAAGFIRNIKEYRESLCFMITNGQLNGKNKDSGHTINKIYETKNHKLESEHDYVDIIRRYQNSLETSENGKRLAKFIIADKDKIISTGKLTRTNNNRVLSYLRNKVEPTSVQYNDFANAHTRFLDCVFKFANMKMSSVINSIQSFIFATLQDKNNATSTLTGILTRSFKLGLLQKSLSSFLNCMRSTDVEVLSGCFRNMSIEFQEARIGNFDTIISMADNYLSIFCNAHEQALNILPKVEYTLNPEKWILNLKKYTEEELKKETDWYQKLVTIFNNVYNMTEGNVAEDLRNLFKELNLNTEIYRNLNAMKVAHETIKSNSINTLANFTYSHVSNKQKLQVTGKFLRLSHVLSSPYCSKKFRILELFALEKIIIDQNLVADSEGLDVYIFAPVWEVVLNKSIILDGVSKGYIKNHTTPAARNGNSLANRNGENGLAGVPGESAGNFYGLTQKIVSAENLKISANGENGGDGKNGGNGADGDDGECPNKDFLSAYLNRHQCAWPRNTQFIYRIKKHERVRYYVPLIGQLNAFTYREECYIFGLDGYPGGHGGQGGVKGTGGMAGDCKLFSMGESSKFPVIMSALNGTDGNPGLGGKAGKGGFTRKATFHNDNYFDYSVTHNTTDVRANDGVDGEDNSSILGKKLEKDRMILQTFAHTANLYKRFILTNVLKHNYTKYVELYKKVISSKQVLDSYDTLTLVEEYIDLEHHYYKTNNKSNTLFLYQSWKERLDYYAAHRNKNEETENHTELLRRLHNTVSEKISGLDKNCHSSLIFKLTDYLVESQQQIKHLQDAKTVVIIKKTNSKYTEEYDDKIEEAQSIIQEQLQCNVTKYNDELNGEMEMLIRKISRLSMMEQARAEEMSKISQVMQQKAVIKTFNDIFSIVVAGLGIINPALATIGTKISIAGSIVQSFIDETADKDVVCETIPNMVDKSRQFFNNWVDIKKDFQKLSIQDDLKVITKKRAELIEKGQDIEPLNNIEGSFLKMRNIIQSGSMPQGDVVQALNVEIEEVESIWQKLAKKKKYIYTEALKVLKHLKTYTKVKQLLGDILTRSTDLKDIRRIDGISDQIERAYEKTRSLRNFKEEIFTEMIPLLTKIRESSNVGSKLQSTSAAFLDFKKFQLKEYFDKIMNQIEYFAKDFNLESYFEKTLKEMKSVINMILSTYIRIEEYVQTMKKADYEKDLYLAPFDITYVKDTRLSMALAKMVQSSFANIVLDDYSKWMASFKHYIFPFADEFMGAFESPIPEVEDLYSKAQDAGERLEMFGSKMNKKRAELEELQNTVDTKFGYSLPPFHVWNNSLHATEINDILSGKMVTLFANISEHKNLNAVKFSEIWLRMRPTAPELMGQILADFQGFAVNLTHNGDSYYRCDNRVFMISSNSHSFNRVFYDDQVLTFDEKVAIKIMEIESMKSDYILSPYASWTIQITSLDTRKKFKVLEKYKSEVDIELVGLGRYTDGNMPVCKTNLEEFYENEL